MIDRAAHLAGLLQAHVPADEREQGFVARMMELLEHDSGDPFSRDHWAPGHFTASAFLLSPDGHDLLLIFHGKLERWLQPGGHVDPEDSDILAAALREVAEETGKTDVDVVGDGLFDVDIHTIPARKGDPDHEHLDVRVLLQCRTRAFAAGSDATAARWVRLEDINEDESDESVMRAVRKLLDQRR